MSLNTSIWIALIQGVAICAHSAVVVQRPGDVHLALQAETATVSDLGGTGSKFVVLATQDLAPALASRTKGRGVLAATSGAKGDASNLGSKATYRLRFSQPGDYRLFFRAAVRNNALIPSADSFFVFTGWNGGGTPVQENESALSAADYGWFLANSVGNIRVTPADLGRDLSFTIANREANFVLDKLVLVSASTTPTTATLDAWTSPIQTAPEVTLLKPVVDSPFTGRFFGNAVDLDGSLVVVGAFGDGGEDDDGTVFVFDRSTGELVSRFQDESPEAIATGNRLAQFGRSVAISDGIVVVASGFHFDIENYQNHAFLYDALTGAFITELVPTGTPVPVNNFTVDIEGDLAIVGAVHRTDVDTVENTEPGVAFLFHVPSGTQLRMLRMPGVRTNAHFGAAVKLSGDLAIIGAPFAENDGFGGGAYVFDVTTGGLIAKLLPDEANPFNSFGSSVALEDNLAVVGDPEDSEAGAIYVFNARTGQRLHKLPAPNPSPGAQFGATVSLSQGKILAGSPANCGATDAPKAFLFDAASGALLATLARADFDRGCFGRALAIHGDRAIVGSMFSDDGSAFLYRSFASEAPLPGVFQEVDGMITIEAEHVAALHGGGSHAWVESAARPGLAGNAAMAALPNLGTLLEAEEAAASATPRLTYRVNFSSAGTWRFWLRGLGDTPSDDSAYVGIDAVLQKRVTPAGDSTWRWNYATVTVPAPGVHEANVWLREDGFFLDRLVLTKNTTFIPSGIGPPESPSQ